MKKLLLIGLLLLATSTFAQTYKWIPPDPIFVKTGIAVISPDSYIVTNSTDKQTFHDGITVFAARIIDSVKLDYSKGDLRVYYASKDIQNILESDINGWALVAYEYSGNKQIRNEFSCYLFQNYLGYKIALYLDKHGNNSLNMRKVRYWLKWSRFKDFTYAQYCQ